MAAAWGVVLLFDGHPFVGILALVGALALIIAGTALREHSRRADLSDALYISGDDMIGYRSQIRRRHGS